MKATLLVVFSVSALAADAPALWTPEFSLNVQTIGEVAPSPDGEWAAWTQIKPVTEGDRSEQVSQIYASDLHGRRFELTRGPRGATAPEWSPDGRYVYFLSGRSGKNNVYRILIEGGEAEQVTDTKGEVGAFHVSPNGKWVAYTAYEPPPDVEKAKKEKRDFHVVDSDPENQVLFLLPAEVDADGKRPAKKIADAKYHVVNFDWSPDSRSIAFEHWTGPLADNWTRSGLAEVTVEGGAVRELVSKGAPSAPKYSPNGRYIAFEQSAGDPPRWPREMRLALLTLADGSVRQLPATPDESPALIGWSGDSARLYFGEAHHTRNAIYNIPVDGPAKPVYAPEHGVMGRITLNRAGNRLGFAYETPTDAPEAFVASVDAPNPMEVSRANAELPKLPLGETKVIHWKGAGGLDIEGLLTYPVDYTPGKKVPLILNIHGGPAGVFTENFIGRFAVYPIATFAARGYAVLRPNPRGSSGYGKDFRFANIGDWGGKDYEDDMAGVDKVIEMGVADPDRMAVMGWSYGGFMTSWVVGHTDRFKAAVVGAGVTDLLSFNGTADIPGFLPDYFGGEPWAAYDAFSKHSPITYVNRVKTPTLILHGEADARVPTTQGYEFYHALKRRGVTTKMVVYPRTPHGPREPKFILDIAQRHLAWVDDYVR
jgi:dipeptidyl aminopeptidase/acylaminoacyl peptidase